MAAGPVRVHRLAAERRPAASRMAGPEVRPLRQVGLAHDDRPGRAQPGDQECVTGLGAVQGRRAGRGRLAVYRDVVLDQHRNAFERPARLPACPGAVAGAGLVSRVLAWSRASWLTVTTACSSGFSRSILPRQNAVSSADVSDPADSACWSPATVAVRASMPEPAICSPVDSGADMWRTIRGAKKRVIGASETEPSPAAA